MQRRRRSSKRLHAELLFCTSLSKNGKTRTRLYWRRKPYPFSFLLYYFYFDIFHILSKQLQGLTEKQNGENAILEETHNETAQLAERIQALESESTDLRRKLLEQGKSASTDREKWLAKVEEIEKLRDKAEIQVDEAQNLIEKLQAKLDDLRLEKDEEKQNLLANISQIETSEKSLRQKLEEVENKQRDEVR